MPEYPTAERLREVLSYNRRTGIFRWKIALSPRTRVGDIAGSLGSRGYLSIQIDGTICLAHRLAWLYVHGWLPSLVDHKNQNILKNNISNLRAASRGQNQGNRRKQIKPTSSRYKGVCWSRARRKWQAYIRINNRQRFLGLFEVEIDAARAYQCAAQKVFGEFARAA